MLHSVRYTLDPMGRQTSVTESRGAMTRTSSFTYDKLGRKTSETTPEGITTHYQYNAASLVTATYGGVYQREYTYTPQDRVESLTVYRDENTTETTRFYYDRAGNLQRKVYPDGNYELFSRRTDGKVIAFTNCRGTTVRYRYDQFGNLSSIIGPDGFYYGFAYDVNHRPVKVTDSDGIIHSLEYDFSGRLASENSSDIPNTEVRYVYDQFMRRNFICFDRRHIEYRYDAASRLNEVHYDGLRFEYSRAIGTNNITSLNAANAQNTVYEHPRGYNDLWDLTSVGDTSYIVNLDGMRTQTTLSDDSKWNYTYDGQNQVTNGILTDSNDVPIVEKSYSYDQMGNHLGISFLRDADGNTLDVNGYTCTYDALNRLSTLTRDGVTFKLKYDYSSRLIKLEKYTGIMLDYTDRYVYDGWNLLATYRDGALVKFYTWGEDLSGTMTGAGGVGGLLAEDNEAGIFLPQYDGNGNIIRYLNSNGDTVASYSYDPFGNILTQSSAMTDDFTFKFSTKSLMPFNLYYYGFRFYNPQTKTWLTRDPIRENGGINLHCFLFNNSINGIDYLGRNWVTRNIITPVAWVGERAWDGTKWTGEQAWDGTKWVGEQVGHGAACVWDGVVTAAEIVFDDRFPVLGWLTGPIGDMGKGAGNLILLKKIGFNQFYKGAKKFVVYIAADVSGAIYGNTYGKGAGLYSAYDSWKNENLSNVDTVRGFFLPIIIPNSGNYGGANWGTDQQKLPIATNYLNNSDFKPFFSVPTKVEYGSFLHDYQMETKSVTNSQAHLNWIENVWTGEGVEPGPLGQIYRFIGTPAFLIFSWIDK